MKLLAKNFENRTDLERKIQETTGDSPERKDKYTIEGTRAELAQFNLSDTSTVYGWQVVITDTPTQQKTQTPVPDRGQRYKSGINNRE